MSEFVHLRVHSEFSLVDSVVRIDPLVARTAALGMSALALTDLSNVSAMVKYSRAAIKAGIKPILGADLWIGASRDDADPTRLTLLCANRQGFSNLSRLLTESHARGLAHGRALVLKAWLDPENLAGLLALSGGQNGEVGRALASNQPARAGDVLDGWESKMPGRFYVEVQRLGRVGEHEYLQRAVELAAARSIPVVATNEVCFLKQSDFEAHETRVCIAQGRTLNDPARERNYTPEQYLKSPAEMAQRFAELPEALANTVEIAKRCNLELNTGKVFLPSFELPGQGTARTHLRELAERGLNARLEANRIEPTGEPAYRERLARELDVICTTGFEGYFLIVADFIAWARANSIPVGPGRGSGAGSLVAYALNITDLDPLTHDLLFERFLNPERVSLPDFDIDFCIEGRDRVIDYVSGRYGKDRVSQIVTYGTMAARAVVRDVGRVLGLPYGYVDRIAKLVPFELGITLDKALADDEELRKLYASDDEVHGLIDLARELEGLARNAGTHAGGVVIAPAPLTEFMPLFVDPHGASLTQLDKDDLEALGLVKFDFLGLKTLTIIDKAVAAINADRARRGEEPIDIAAIGVDDRRTYDLLNRCQTTAVFQLESRGMRDLIKRLKPDCFDDIVAVLALFRPGPLQSGMVDEFIERKHGRNSRPIDYLHPSLEPVLKPTYGVILYQDQVMRIAQILAGYSLGGADVLRYAMGKKKPEEMAEQRAVFLAGATARGIAADQAGYIFDLMEKFAGYGFNKSHSSAYALLAYQTAWLKAHYPEAFMAAVLTADMDHTDKLVVFIHDCRKLGISIDPPNINTSGLGFSVGGRQRVSYGLGAIKGVGRGVVESILAERDAGGPYTSLSELCRRVGYQKVNRRVIEALVCSGALDGMGHNRATLLSMVPETLKRAEQTALADAAGQATLFGAEDSVPMERVFPPLREWTKRERLDHERESLGLYLTGHPFDHYAEHWRRLNYSSIAEVIASLPLEGQPFQRKIVALAGAVMDLKRRGSRIVVVLDDGTERVEVSLFDEVYAACKHLLSKDAVLVVDGSLRYDEFSSAWGFTAKSVKSFDEVIEEQARCITISLTDSETGLELIGELKATFEPFRRGNCEVSIQYRSAAGQALLTCGDAWSVRPTRELRERLSRLLGEDRFTIHYPKHAV